MAQRVALMEVARDSEFAPVKNAPGSASDSPDTARQAILSLHQRLVHSIHCLSLKGHCIELMLHLRNLWNLHMGSETNCSKGYGHCREGSCRDHIQVPTRSCFCLQHISLSEMRCAAAYEKDPAFQDESLLSKYTNRHRLWCASGDKLVIPAALRGE